MWKNLSFCIAIGSALLLQSCGPRSLTREEIKAFESCIAEVKHDFYQAKRKFDKDKAIDICAKEVGVTIADMESTDYDAVMFGEK